MTINKLIESVIIQKPKMNKYVIFYILYVLTGYALFVIIFFYFIFPMIVDLNYEVLRYIEVNIIKIPCACGQMGVLK